MRICLNSIKTLVYWWLLTDTHCIGVSNEKHRTKQNKSGPSFNTKMYYQCRKFHCGDKTISRPSHLHNGISYTGKTTHSYWFRALGAYVKRQILRLHELALLELNFMHPTHHLRNASSINYESSLYIWWQTIKEIHCLKVVLSRTFRNMWGYNVLHAIRDSIVKK